MKVKIEERKIVTVTGFPESRPHGGYNLPGCPVCEALERIYRKNKRRPRREIKEGE